MERQKCQKCTNINKVVYGMGSDLELVLDRESTRDIEKLWHFLIQSAFRVMAQDGINMQYSCRKKSFGKY